MYDRDKGEYHTSTRRARSAIASLPPEKGKQRKTTVIISFVVNVLFVESLSNLFFS